jgi:hypothetical protein
METASLSSHAADHHRERDKGLCNSLLFCSGHATLDHQAARPGRPLCGDRMVQTGAGYSDYRCGSHGDTTLDTNNAAECALLSYFHVI